MYIKKNLMLWLAVLAVALPLILTGTASAKYLSDGAVPNGQGEWAAPIDGICALSLSPTGTYAVDTTVPTVRDCQARLIVTTPTTSAPTKQVCGNSAGNTAGLLYAAPGSSTCVTVNMPYSASTPSSGLITGTISMKNLDRSAQMCNGNGGFLASDATNVNQAEIMATGGNACVAYGWQNAGQNPATGAPLTFGANGVTGGISNTNTAGFCYFTGDLSTAYSVATCPTSTSNATVSLGYSISGGKCVYSYVITGYPSAALTNPTVSTGGALQVVTAADTFVDLSGITTQGACVVAGGTWNNWGVNVVAGSTSTASVATTANASTIVKFNTALQAIGSTDGCLHCHSSLVQDNSLVDRWSKDTYLKTGHKNMLRKVGAASTKWTNWAGPDGVIYTTDGALTTSDTISWPADSAYIYSKGVNTTLTYIVGDWMTVYPTLEYPGSAYSCAACHTTGYNDSVNPGTQSLGTPGYNGAQPAAAGTNYAASVSGGDQWDLEGIQCGRCHNAAAPAEAQANITGGCTGTYTTQSTCNAGGYAWVASESSFSTTVPVTTGMGNLAAGTGRVNLCFGCHQSIAKLWPAEGGTSAGTTQYDPTLIPASITATKSDFSGHVLGNSFLNSVHARYSGVNSATAPGGIQNNSLGKFDLVDPNGTVEYNSQFQGYLCGSPGATFPSQPSIDTTNPDGSKITTKTQCDALYACSLSTNTTVKYPTQTACTSAGGKWASTWQSDGQGTCTTCHDVHNSLFVPSESQASIRKSCEDCHVNNVASVTGPVTNATSTFAPQVENFNHPQVGGTPFDTSLYSSSCEVCHMALVAVGSSGDASYPPYLTGQFQQLSFAMHVWRINTSPNYSTFPTYSVFSGSNGLTKDDNAQTSPESYMTANGTTAIDNKAVWVDVDRLRPVPWWFEWYNLHAEWRALQDEGRPRCSGSKYAHAGFNPAGSVY